MGTLLDVELWKSTLENESSNHVSLNGAYVSIKNQCPTVCSTTKTTFQDSGTTNAIIYD